MRKQKVLFKRIDVVKIPQAVTPKATSNTSEKIRQPITLFIRKG
ncbi:MAG TPA: hypothetical protein VEC36_12675 [Patescibacteria group bacterium]|nr:hypothetical protein [Patescibacteria group bacterium]